MLKYLAFLLAGALAACDASPDTTLATDLNWPLDLQLVGDTLYSLQYDGSVVAVPVDGSPRRELAPAWRRFETGETPILVEPTSYNLLVTGSHLYWTQNRSGRTEVRHLRLDATAPTEGEVVTTELAPIDGLALVEGRACWTGAARIACVELGGTNVTTLALAAQPRSLVENAGVLYWLDAGIDRHGALVALTLETGEAKMLARDLPSPGGMAILHDPSQGDSVYWLDAGTCVEANGGCTGNGDGSLHQYFLSDGIVLVEHAGLFSARDDHVVAVGDAVLYAAEGDLWRSGSGVLHDHERIADVGCDALAATEGIAYCGELHTLRAIGW